MTSRAQYIAMADRADLAGDESGARDLMALAAQESSPDKAESSDDRFQGADQFDVVRGSLPGRIAEGAADLPMGATQLATNLASKWVPDVAIDHISDITGSADDREALGLSRYDENRGNGGEIINELISDKEDGYQKSRKLYGQENDFDGGRLTGSLATGGLALQGLSKAATIGQKLMQGMGTGGAFGASTPVNSPEDYWERKGAQSAVGTLSGVALSGLGQLGAYGGKRAFERWAPLFEGGRQTSQRLLNDIIPADKRQLVADMLRKDINPLGKGSVGEVVAPLEASPRLAALSRSVDDLMPAESRARNLAQIDDQTSVLNSISQAGGGVDEAKAFREAIAGPMRDKALTSATTNNAGIQALEAQKAAARNSQINATRNEAAYSGELGRQLRTADRQAGASGNPSGLNIPKRYTPAAREAEKVPSTLKDLALVKQQADHEARIIQQQIDKISESGVKMSMPDRIVSGLEKSMIKPEVIGDPKGVGKILALIKSDLTKMTRDGVIHPKSLDVYRRTGIGTTIEAYMKNKNSSVSNSVVSEMTRTVKPLIDDAIEEAAGGGWKAYVKTYSRLSRHVDQANLGDEIIKRGVPALAGQKLKAEIIAGSFSKDGVPNPELLKAAGLIKNPLNPKQTKDMVSTLRDFDRTAIYKDQAVAGLPSLGKATNPGDTALPNALVREIMMINATTKRLSDASIERLETELPKLFARDPQTGFKVLADLIDGSNPSTRAQINETAKKIYSIYGKSGNATPALGGIASGELARERR